MSAPAHGPGSEAAECPPGLGDAGRLTPTPSLSVNRGPGTVVVTVDGGLDFAGCELLQNLLTDLIENQGNAMVAVDLGKAIVEPEALIVFIDAARQARRQGTKFVLYEPPTDTHEALQSGDFGGVVEVLPRAAPSG